MEKKTSNSNFSEIYTKAKRCSNCILSGNRLDMNLNEFGICNFCQNEDIYGKKQKHETITWEKFAEVLRVKYSTKNSRYQCMALLSGGKDSIYMLHLLSKIPNFRVVAVTVDHWFNSIQAEVNIRTILKKIPVDHINFRPSWSMAKELYKEAIIKTGKLCLVCEAFLTTEIYRFAVEMKIPCMAWGLSAHQFRTPPEWITEIDKTYWDKMDKRFVKPMGQAIGLGSELYQCFRNCYISTVVQQSTFFPDLLFPFLALEYNPSEAEIVASSLGWQRPCDVPGTSSNCYGQHLHIYLNQKIKSHEAIEDELAVLVRRGIISRERAIIVLETEASKEKANNILAEIGLDIDVDCLADHLKTSKEI
jgi:hypothetical protein